MSRISEKINSKDLFNELQMGIEKDRRYWLQNDAKLRAATTSKSYDEFREIVAAAHLQPLLQEDKTKRINTWNRAAGNRPKIE